MSTGGSATADVDDYVGSYNVELTCTNKCRYERMSSNATQPVFSTEAIHWVWNGDYDMIGGMIPIYT